MGFKYGFYNALNENNLYTSENYASILDGIIDEGFFSTYYINKEQQTTNTLIIPFNPKGTSSTENSMQVCLLPFRAWLHHTWNYNDINQIYEIKKSSVLNGRIDVFVVKVDTEKRQNSIEYIPGTPAAVKDLALPDITNTDTIFYFPIAYIYVPRRTYNITTTNIISVIGINNPVITINSSKSISLPKMNTVSAPSNSSYLSSTEYVQDILDRFEDFKTDNTEAFKEWFAGVKEIFKNYTQDDIKKYEKFEERIQELEARQGNIIVKLTFATTMIGSTVTFHNNTYTQYSDKTANITSANQFCYLEHIGNYTITENKTGKQIQMEIPYYGEYEGAFTSPIYIFKNSIYQGNSYEKSVVYIGNNSGNILQKGYAININSSSYKIEFINNNLSTIWEAANRSYRWAWEYMKIVLSHGNYNRLVANGKYAISKYISFQSGMSNNSFGIIFSGDDPLTKMPSDIDDKDCEYPYLLTRRPNGIMVGTYNYIKDFSIDTQLSTSITDFLYINFLASAANRSMGDTTMVGASTFNTGSNIQFEELALYE